MEFEWIIVTVPPPSLPLHPYSVLADSLSPIAQASVLYMPSGILQRTQRAFVPTNMWQSDGGGGGRGEMPAAISPLSICPTHISKLDCRSLSHDTIKTSPYTHQAYTTYQCSFIDLFVY